MCPPLFLYYLLSNYNQTWHDSTLGQNLSKAMKSLLTSSLEVSKTSSSCFGIVPEQKSSSFIFCPIELKLGTGINSEELIQNSSQKIRYQYVLKEKKPLFNGKLKFLPKRSLKKVLPWQHPRLLLTQNNFK